MNIMHCDVRIHALRCSNSCIAMFMQCDVRISCTIQDCCCDSVIDKMQPLVSNYPTTTLSHCFMGRTLRSASDLAVESRWFVSGIVPLSGIQTYQGHDITEMPCVIILAVFIRIRRDVDVNMQSIKSAIQSSHVRTRATCVVSSWPTAFLFTALNLIISCNTSWMIIVILLEMGAWQVTFASVSPQKGTLAR